MAKNVLAQTLLSLSGHQGIVSVHRSFVVFAGNLESGMMLSQLLYWTPRSSMAGWIAKSDLDFSEELCVSVYSVRSARENLKAMGVIDTKLKRFDNAPTIHYKIKMNILQEKWSDWIATEPKLYRKDDRFCENEESDFANSQNGFCENEESLTETTSEITKAPVSSARSKPEPEYIDDGNEFGDKPAKKSKRAQRETPEMFDLAQAMAEVCGISFEANRSRLFKESKLMLADKRVSAPIIIRDYSPGGAWYREDWRGKKGERPTITSIRQTMFSWGSTAPAVKQNITGSVKARD